MSGHRDRIPGGKADNLRPKDFDQRELKMGVKDEASEHTDRRSIAEEIAMDHLAKDPHYYSKMKKLESKMKTSAMRDELIKIALVKKKATIVKYAFIQQAFHAAGDTVKAFANPIASAKAGWIHPTNKGFWKGVGVLGTAAAVPGALKKEDPSGQGQTRAQRFGRVAGGAIGGTIGMSVPGAGLVSGVTGSVLGERIGKGIGSGASAVKRAIKKGRSGKVTQPPVAAQPPPQG